MKVRLVRYVSGTEKWMADLGAINGKRVQRYFDTKEQAEEEIRKAKGEVRDVTSSIVSLGAGEKIRFIAARDRLWKLNATIEDAVEFFEKHHHALKLAPDLGTLRREYLDDLCRKKRSARYQRHAAGNLQNFLETVVGKTIGEITRDDVEAWVLDSGLAAGTQANRLVTARAFLQWAKKRRYISISPIEGISNLIELPASDRGEILSFGPEDVRALFRMALAGTYKAFNRETRKFYDGNYRDLIGYLTAMCFCGVRPEEIQRSDITALKMQINVLKITKEASKTNQIRVIKLSEAAKAWFALWLDLYPDAERFTLTNFDRKWRALRKAAGLTDWVHDGLRHTFATMHYATHESASKLKKVLGHSDSEDTLFRHYSAVQTASGETITPEMAAEFWAITPETVRQPDQTAEDLLRQRGVTV